jgi:hypothetical protein
MIFPHNPANTRERGHSCPLTKISAHPGLSRRAFLRRSLAASVAPLVLPGAVLGLNGAVAPSNRIVVGSIGLGFAWHMFLRRNDTQFVAVCDVQQSRRTNGKRMVDEHYGNDQCAAYNDFREVLARRDIDAVYIATPDHWHSVITIAAARAGKAVYCQKPLTRTIAEGQAVVEAVRRHNIVFQHGTQQRHDQRMLFGCELVRNGYIGQLTHVKIGSPEGIVLPPQPSEPVPAGLDWDMWLGPAPAAPFSPFRIRAHEWYFLSDYCMGYIAGWGIHHADSAAQGTGVDVPAGPIEVDARGEFPVEGPLDTPFRWDMKYRFSNGVTWHWTDTDIGNPQKRGIVPAQQERSRVRHPMGVRFEGSEGWVFIWRGVVDAHPKSLLNVKIGPNDKVRLVQPGGEPIPDFIQCVREKRPTCAPVEIAHNSTNLCSIAAIGMELRQKIVWDPAREQFVNNPEANRLKSRAMREPWHL